MPDLDILYNSMAPGWYPPARMAKCNASPAWIAEALAGEAMDVNSVAGALADMYGRYAEEWNGFPYAVPLQPRAT